MAAVRSRAALRALFEHDGRTSEALRIEGESSSPAWIAGIELEGRITVSTEHCDTMVSEAVEVERTPDGCHVATELVLLDVGSLGYLAAEPPVDDVSVCTTPCADDLRRP